MNQESHSGSVIMEKRYSEKMETFHRKWTLPEEDRTGYSSAGRSFRWFRSPNVVCIEHYRRHPKELLEDQGTDLHDPAA